MRGGIRKGALPPTAASNILTLIGITETRADLLQAVLQDPEQAPALLWQGELQLTRRRRLQGSARDRPAAGKLHARAAKPHGPQHWHEHQQQQVLAAAAAKRATAPGLRRLLLEAEKSQQAAAEDEQLAQRMEAVEEQELFIPRDKLMAQQWPAPAPTKPAAMLFSTLDQLAQGLPLDTSSMVGGSRIFVAATVRLASSMAGTTLEAGPAAPMQQLGLDMDQVPPAAGSVRASLPQQLLLQHAAPSRWGLEPLIQEGQELQFTSEQVLLQSNDDSHLDMAVFKLATMSLTDSQALTVAAAALPNHTGPKIVSPVVRTAVTLHSQGGSSTQQLACAAGADGCVMLLGFPKVRASSGSLLSCVQLLPADTAAAGEAQKPEVAAALQIRAAQEVTAGSNDFIVCEVSAFGSWIAVSYDPPTQSVDASFTFEANKASIRGHLEAAAEAGVYGCGDIFTENTTQALGSPCSVTVSAATATAAIEGASGSTMMIDLGLNATVMPGQFLVVSPTTKLVSSTNTAQRLQGSFELGSCTSCAAPSAVIIGAATVISSCAGEVPLVLDASSSADRSAGRPLAAVEWGLAPYTGATPAAGSSALAALQLMFPVSNASQELRWA